MWHVFEADTANQLWAQTVFALRQGSDVRVEPSRNGNTREILHAALTLRNPRARWVTSRRPALNPAFAIAEVFWILGGRRDAQFLTYFNRAFPRHAGTSDCLYGAYGYRLRRHFYVDQIERAYAILKANPNSRQVVLQIWDTAADLPHLDGRPRDADIPCNTQSVLKIRNGMLEWLQIMRSNDIFLGLPHNLIQFTLLQEVIAGWLGLGLGHYHHVSDSLHLYDHDSDLLKVEQANELVINDTFSLPRAKSLPVISTVIKLVEQIVDEHHSTAEILALTENQLPEAYQNALRVMIAEGARRRKAAAAANKIMSACTSTTFQLMWRNWCDRLSVV